MVAGRTGLIAALDVGTTKVCCFVGRTDTEGRLRVVGIGHQVSRGLKAGTIIDMEAAESSIRAAVEAAERMARHTVERVFVSLSGGHPSSQIIDVEVAIAGHEIRGNDLTRALHQAHVLAAQQSQGREIIHAIPAGYAIDGTPGYRDPRGMYGSRLGVNLHAVSAVPGPIRNLRQVVERCHLETEGLVLAPYAAGLASLVEDETDLGVTLIDMGGGTTSIAVFYGGHLVHTDVVAVGGGHVTNDIARGLSTPTRDAERLKVLHGSAIAGPADDRDMVAVPQVGESGAGSEQQIPRSMLIGIIQPRIEETLELVRDRLEASGFARMAGRRAVLTGGASLLTGVRELGARILDKQVRVGRPLRIQGLAEATEGPAFAVCAGLLAYAARGYDEVTIQPDVRPAAVGGRLAQFGRWLKENF